MASPRKRKAKKSRPPQNKPTHLPATTQTDALARNGSSTTSILKWQSEYEGPLPPPALLKAFDEAVPGLSQIIVDEFTLQSAHRRKIEEQVITHGTRHEREGLRLGFALLAGLLIVSGLAFYWGYVGEALATLIASLCAAVGVYYVGKRSQR